MVTLWCKWGKGFMTRRLNGVMGKNVRVKVRERGRKELERTLCEEDGSARVEGVRENGIAGLDLRARKVCGRGIVGRRSPDELVLDGVDSDDIAEGENLEGVRT